MKELEDYRWFPPLLRNFQMEFIGFVVSRFPIYTAFITHLKTLDLPLQSMTDLCSGSGEPAIHIFKKSNCFTNLTLTDKYPNLFQLQDEQISYKMESEDVLEMEFKSSTCYTMFNALHHFKDEDKIMIAKKIQASGSTGFFVELLEPTLINLLKVLLLTTFGTLLLTPFIQPFSFKRLFFTYILPINIFTITYDGMVSVSKTRLVEQYQRLFKHHADTIRVCKLANNISPLIVIQMIQKK